MNGRLILFLMFLFGIGTGALLYSRGIKKKGAESYSWPSVKGKVKESFLTNRGVSGNRRIDTHVLFEYRVGRKKYESDNIRFGGPDIFGGNMTITDPLRDLHQVIERYPEGSEVEVFYNPKRPRECCLEKGEVSSRIFMYAGLGFYFMCLLSVYLDQ
jgi:hypothetical protein